MINNSEKPIFSIIVPIYNAEAYIERCLLSILNQPVKNIEVICIDDASPDGSGAIVQRMQKKDLRIKYLKHERNLGIGEARNTGLKDVSGHYILFTDSDDFWEENAFIKLQQYAKENADIVLFGHNTVSESGEITGTVKHKNSLLVETDKNNKSIFFKCLLHKKKYFLKDKNNFGFYNFCAVWKRMHKTEMIKSNNISFRKDVYYEDALFSLQETVYAKNVKIVDDILYNYFTNINSVTHKFNDITLFSHFAVFTEMYDFIRKMNIFNDVKKSYFARRKAMIKYHLKKLSESPLNEIEKREYLIKFYSICKATDNYLKIYDKKILYNL